MPGRRYSRSGLAYKPALRPQVEIAGIAALMKLALKAPSLPP
jgi:hypothetical protein